MIKLLNDGHCITSKITTGDEMYIPFFDVRTHQESKVWVFKDDTKSTMTKRQRQKKK